MTKAQPTPGPWETSGDGGIWGTSPHNARFRVASVTTPSPMNGVDWQANAKLIAAAPKLLEALQMARNFYGDNLDVEDETETRVMTAIDNAIAKATKA